MKRCCHGPGSFDATLCVMDSFLINGLQILWYVCLHPQAIFLIFGYSLLIFHFNLFCLLCVSHTL